MNKNESSLSVLHYCKTQKWGTFLAIFVLIFVRISVCFGYVVVESRAEPTLRFLSILHRHGERAPTITYPLDPYQNETYWPDGRNELLQKGKQTMFEVGKFLRSRYDGFLPSRYRSTDVYTLSSYYNRCLMSAETLLAGLYPPVGDQIWNHELLWQPIPVHSLPNSADDIIRVKKPCPLLSKEKENINVTINIKLKENQDLINYLSNHTGLNLKSIKYIYQLYDNLLITSEQGYKLPEWTQDIYPDKLKSLARIHYMNPYSTFTMKKLGSGVLINDIVSSMKKKRTAKGEFKRLLNLYSAHDTTIMRLWQAMNVTQELTDLSGYGATFIVELHEIQDKFRVKILYKNYGWDKELRVLGIKGCENDETAHQDGMCDLDVFSSALQPVMVTDFHKECQIPQQSSVSALSSTQSL